MQGTGNRPLRPPAAVPEAQRRREFRECENLPDDLPGINAGIDGFAELCNHRRPHGALQGRTPAEYLETIAESGGPESLS